MTWEALPARVLDKHELQALVDDLATRPELWRDYLAFSEDKRHYVSLYRDEHVDVWLLCWTPANDTGWHDHDISSGAVRIVQGAVTESNPRLGGEHVVTVIAEGRSFCFGPEHIHRMSGERDGTVTIHAYSPPLWRLGQYAISPDGIMRRLSLSYAEELRPFDPAA
jgi:predicted metal-dependent enzyme (double-stranded beta helix superfamily)